MGSEAATSMTTIALFSVKGGVGKTTLAVNLAWAAASLSQRRTLLWDLDGQGAASWLLGYEGTGNTSARALFGRDVDPRSFVVRTPYDRLDLLPADLSLHGLDILFHGLGRKKLVARIAEDLSRDYDRVVIDCSPSLSETTEQVLRAAALVVVPVIPAPLARRALDVIAARILRRKGPRVTFAPVFSMVDRRRAMHRAAIAEQPSWPIIPAASAIEQMTVRRAPLGVFLSARQPPVQAVTDLWTRMERELSRLA
jgi:chromosome partitioning protein